MKHREHKKKRKNDEVIIPAWYSGCLTCLAPFIFLFSVILGTFTLMMVGILTF